MKFVGQFLDLAKKVIKNGGMESVTSLPTTNNFEGREVNYKGTKYIYYNGAWRCHIEFPVGKFQSISYNDVYTENSFHTYNKSITFLIPQDKVKFEVMDNETEVVEELSISDQKKKDCFNELYNSSIFGTIQEGKTYIIKILAPYTTASRLRFISIGISGLYTSWDIKVVCQRLSSFSQDAEVTYEEDIINQTGVKSGSSATSICVGRVPYSIYNDGQFGQDTAAFGFNKIVFYITPRNIGDNPSYWRGAFYGLGLYGSLGVKNLYNWDSDGNTTFTNSVNSQETLNYDVTNIKPTQTGTVKKSSSWIWQYLVQSVNWLRDRYSGNVESISLKAKLNNGVANGYYLELNKKDDNDRYLGDISFNVSEPPTGGWACGMLVLTLPSLGRTSFIGALGSKAILDEVSGKISGELTYIYFGGVYNNPTARLYPYPASSNWSEQERFQIDKSGTIIPALNDTYTCGTSSKIWNAVFSKVFIEAGQALSDKYAAKNQVLNYDINNIKPTQAGEVEKSMQWILQYFAQSINWLRDRYNYGRIEAGQNLDDFYKDGVYFVAPTATNNPAQQYGILRVLPYIYTDGVTQRQNFEAQIFYNTSGQGEPYSIYYRHKTSGGASGVWKSWIKLPTKVDDVLSDTSKNPVQNKVVTQKINNHTHNGTDSQQIDYANLENKPTIYTSATINGTSVDFSAQNNNIPAYISYNNVLFPFRFTGSAFQIYRNEVWADLVNFDNFISNDRGIITESNMEDWYRPGINEYFIDESAAVNFLTLKKPLAPPEKWTNITINTGTLTNKITGLKSTVLLDNIRTNIKNVFGEEPYTLYTEYDISAMLDSGFGYKLVLKLEKGTAESNSVIVECYKVW